MTSMSLETTQTAPAHEPISFALLLSVLKLQSKSGQEEEVRVFLRKFFTDNNIPFYEDQGNLYATKDDGSGPDVPYACLVSHIDTVHALVPEKVIYWNDDAHNELTAGGPVNEKGRYIPTGLGADDLVGVALCLEAVLRLPKIKVAFFKEEETGTNGSRVADIGFFSDVSMILQGDRRGKSDITEAISGKWMNSKEWREAIDPLIKQYKRKWCDGMLTDVLALKSRRNGATYAGVNVCVANLSCGYYLPHQKDEYIKINEVQETLFFMLDIFKLIGHKQWVHGEEAKVWGGGGSSWKHEGNYKSRFVYDDTGHNGYKSYEPRYDKTSLNYFCDKGYASKDAILAQYEFVDKVGWVKKKGASKLWDDEKIFAEDNNDGTHTIWQYDLLKNEWVEHIVNDTIWTNPAEQEPEFDGLDDRDTNEIIKHPTGSCPECGGINLEYDEHATTAQPLWWCSDCNGYHDQKDITKKLLGVTSTTTHLGDDDWDELDDYRIRL